MKSICSIITLSLILFIGLFNLHETGYADENLNVSEYSQNPGAQDGKNDKLIQLGSKTQSGSFIIAEGKNKGQFGFHNLLIQIAKNVKDIFLGIASIFFIIIVLRFLFSKGQEDELDKLKQGIVWITIGIIVMQLSYSFVLLTFDSAHTGSSKTIDGKLAGVIFETLLVPLLALLETAAAFFFVGVGVVAFYKLVTAGGNEESSKSGKMSILYAIIGFIIVKISRVIVNASYSKTLCREAEKPIANCNIQDVSELANIMIRIINWTNTFVGILIVIMIVYTGARIIFSAGEEEEIKKSKSSILYIIIGIVILSINYLILTFFLVPELLPPITP